MPWIQRQSSASCCHLVSLQLLHLSLHYQQTSASWSSSYHCWFRYCLPHWLQCWLYFVQWFVWSCDFNYTASGPHSESTYSPVRAVHPSVENSLPNSEPKSTSHESATSHIVPAAMPAIPPGISLLTAVRMDALCVVGSSVPKEAAVKAIDNPADSLLASVEVLMCHGLTFFPGGSSSSSVVGLFLSVLCIIFTIPLVPVTLPIQLWPLPKPPLPFEPLYMSCLTFDYFWLSFITFNFHSSTPIHLSLDHCVDECWCRCDAYIFIISFHVDHQDFC